MWVAGGLLSGDWVAYGDVLPAAMSRDLTGLWPDVSPRALTVVAALIGLTPFVLGVLLWWRTRPGGTAQALGGHAATSTSRRLRPSLPAKGRLDPRDLGLLIGRDARKPIYASWEDTVLAIMPPRTGKTSSLAIPAVVEAPGGVVSTSN